MGGSAGGIDTAHLATWIGKSETRHDVLHAFPANALAATLDRADPPYAEGTSLPPLWHWLHFLAVHPMSETGPDGHAEKGGFLPPVPLPRRMWAGSRMAFLRPLLIGETASRISTIKSVDHKSGRSGELVFVTVRHEITGPRGLAIEEEHDIVYRSAAQPGEPAPPRIPTPAGADWERPVHPDPVLLFRYSALTFNSHRIHYDLDHVRDVEGYPGLIVHGPLIATLLLDGLRRQKPEAVIRQFTFRARAPLFHIDDFAVCGRFEGTGRANLWAKNAAGALCMEAVAEFC